MSESDSLRELLRREAAGMEISPSYPGAIPRSIRRRRFRFAAIAVLPIAVVLGSVLLSGGGLLDSSNDVAGEGSGGRNLRAGWATGGGPTKDPRLLGRGSDFGLEWQLVLSQARSGPCLELQVNNQAELCDALTDEIAEFVNVFPREASGQGLAYVIGTVPEGRGVGISLRGGGQWAGLIFEGPEGDGRDYFVRVFPTEDVSGVLVVDGTDTGVSFRVQRRANGSVTDVRSNTNEGLPDFEDLPGDVTAIWTEPVGDTFTHEAYDVVLRTTDDEVCLHIEDSLTCEDLPLPDELRLATAQKVGDGVVIAGLVGPAVEEVVAESFEGDRWPQQLQEISQRGVDHSFFVFEADAPFEGRLAITNKDGSSSTAPLRSD